jgi:hypothetical protein
MAVAIALCASITGCMFSMTHQFPPNTQFGRRPEGATEAVAVERSAMKNWLLAGLLPYSRFGTRDLVADPGKDRQLGDVEVETGFNWLDTVIWVVPGFAYGYYVWAPRHVTVRGSVLEGAGPVRPARRP